MRPAPRQRRPCPLGPRGRGVQQRHPHRTLVFLIALQGVVLEHICCTHTASFFDYSSVMCTSFRPVALPPWSCAFNAESVESAGWTVRQSAISLSGAAFRLLRLRQGHEHHESLPRTQFSFFATCAIWEISHRPHGCSQVSTTKGPKGGLGIRNPVLHSTAGFFGTWVTAQDMRDSLLVSSETSFHTQASVIITFLTVVHVQSEPEALYPPTANTRHPQPAHGMLAAPIPGLGSARQSKKASPSADTMMWTRLNTQEEETILFHQRAVKDRLPLRVSIGGTVDAYFPRS